MKVWHIKIRISLNVVGDCFATGLPHEHATAWMAFIKTELPFLNTGNGIKNKSKKPKGLQTGKLPVNY